MNNVILCKDKILYEGDMLPQVYLYCSKCIACIKKMIQQIDLSSGLEEGVSETKRFLLRIIVNDGK